MKKAKGFPKQKPYVRGMHAEQKISVVRGLGPRHAENAKEGEMVSTDTVPAMLTPREAVLNRNAAELAGRGNIEKLNKKGNLLAKRGVDLAAEGDSDVSEAEYERGLSEDFERKLRGRRFKPVKGEQFDPGSGGAAESAAVRQLWDKYGGLVPEEQLIPDFIKARQDFGLDPMMAQEGTSNMKPKKYQSGTGDTDPYAQMYPGSPMPPKGVGQPQPGPGPIPIIQPYPAVRPEAQPRGYPEPAPRPYPPPFQPGGGSYTAGPEQGMPVPQAYQGTAYGGQSASFFPPGRQGPPQPPPPLKAQGGAPDIQPIGEPQQGYPWQMVPLSSGQLSTLQKEMQKQGLDKDQIAGLTQAFKGFGQMGAGGQASPGAGVYQAAGSPTMVYGESGYPSAIPVGGYSGGISDIGYPPFIAPTAEYHADKGSNWVGPFDQNYIIPRYCRGTTDVPRFW